MKPLRILTTGHKGYIAQSLSPVLREETCDIKTNGDFRDIRGQHFDVVVHLASSVSVTESMENPKLYYENNVYKLRSFLMNNIIDRFVFTSTGGAMYGNKVLAKESDAKYENCLSPYAKTKFEAEEIIRAFCPKHCILRLANVVGGDTSIRGEASAEAHFQKDDPIVVYGGTQTRDFIDIYTVGLAIRRAALGQDIGTFNIGSGAHTGVLTMALSYAQKRKVDVQIKPARAGEVDYISLDCSAAREAGLL